ncbi:hypothetical protein GCM10023193_24240 [Planotetraspora kaengkrachanensis]|uniref:WD40 repeat domain-containing protein n=2 Tax=Planotetraspora kaengkrachanensis TaxID=575193 RepID=A0A8J3PSU4_9ACTN|nr:hypothetical protein Pka01_29910 [Planotetraspora kaengkrachanensis]
MDDWSREAHVPADLADRALRRRSHRRLGTAVIAALATAAVVTSVALVVPRFGPHDPVATPARHEVIHLAPAHRPPAKVTSGVDTEGGILTDTGNSPPQKMLAAGRVAVSAYWTGRRHKTGNGGETFDRTWYLLDPVTRTYRKTPWAYLDVAPGLRYAAVLEKTLPARRIGVLDMETRKVLAWIPVDRPVGGIAWSPDGTRLLATAYDRDPDGDSEPHTECPPGSGGEAPVEGPGSEDHPPIPNMIGTSRTGFYVIDVAAADAGDFHAVDPCAAESSPWNTRRDFQWSTDGSLVYEWGVSTERPALFYDLGGRPHDPPSPDSLVLSRGSQAGVSPDGRLLAGPAGLPTAVTELSTGKVVGSQQVLQLLAWADDDHLIGLGCAGTCGNEFNNGLVLVSVDGRKSLQLAAFRKNTQKPGSWEPVLTLR